jgi:hypothetical protein
VPIAKVAHYAGGSPQGRSWDREVGSENLPYLSASPSPWALSHDPVEQVAEVRLANKAAFRGDLGDGIIGHQQKALSTLDAPAYEVLVRRAAKVVLEDAPYAVRTTSYDPGEIGDSDAGLQVGGNMPLEATHLPRCDVGALRHDPRRLDDRRLAGMFAG